uniref:G protein-coupled receptor n=1 Tax=Caenorhabditis tropicalis TaxID=1561998 RepID=A0A1I7V254_9PELO
MTLSAGILFLYTYAWHAINVYLGDATLETRKYIKEDFNRVFGLESMEVNRITCLYKEGTENTVIRSWTASTLCMTISTFSICAFLIIAYMIMKKLNRLTDKMSRKTSNLQIDLLRALIVQTVIPIFISFLPCVFGLFSPAFNLDLGRPINYVEVIALGAFAFCDPVAIVICLPVFRTRITCQGKSLKHRGFSNGIETAVP